MLPPFDAKPDPSANSDARCVLTDAFVELSTTEPPDSPPVPDTEIVPVFTATPPAPTSWIVPDPSSTIDPASTSPPVFTTARITSDRASSRMCTVWPVTFPIEYPISPVPEMSRIASPVPKR